MAATLLDSSTVATAEAPSRPTIIWSTTLKDIWKIGLQARVNPTILFTRLQKPFAERSYRKMLCASGIIQPANLDFPASRYRINIDL